jgi:Mitochondrial mRNA-processing protein COX24, C-terminal
MRGQPLALALAPRLVVGARAVARPVLWATPRCAASFHDEARLSADGAPPVAPEVWAGIWGSTLDVGAPSVQAPHKQPRGDVSLVGEPQSDIPLVQEPLDDVVNLEATSILKKRRKKMRKHKWKKNRKKQRFEKMKLGKI